MHGAAELTGADPASSHAVAEQAIPACIETSVPVVEQTIPSAPSEGSMAGGAGQPALHPTPVAEQAVAPAGGAGATDHNPEQPPALEPVAEQAIVAMHPVPPPAEPVHPMRAYIRCIEFAASGRSKCRACGETIALRCVRFGVFLQKKSRLG